jgi:alcohol dehydrogenase class IV
MLPHVVRFNAADDDRPYADLVVALPGSPGNDRLPAGERLAEWLQGVVAAGGLAPSLSAAGIATPDLGLLAAAAASQWTAGFNPRPVDAEDLTRLYEEAR